jgi:hypothetical protein
MIRIDIRHVVSSHFDILCFSASSSFARQFRIRAVNGLDELLHAARFAQAVLVCTTLSPTGIRPHIRDGILEIVRRRQEFEGPRCDIGNLAVNTVQSVHFVFLFGWVSKDNYGRETSSVTMTSPGGLSLGDSIISNEDCSLGHL